MRVLCLINAFFSFLGVALIKPKMNEKLTLTHNSEFLSDLKSESKNKNDDEC